MRKLDLGGRSDGQLERKNWVSTGTDLLLAGQSSAAQHKIWGFHFFFLSCIDEAGHTKRRIHQMLGPGTAALVAPLMLMAAATSFNNTQTRNGGPEGFPSEGSAGWGRHHEATRTAGGARRPIRKRAINLTTVGNMAPCSSKDYGESTAITPQIPNGAGPARAITAGRRRKLAVEGPSFALWTRVEPKEWAALVSRAAHKGSGSPRRARPELTLKQLGAGSSSVRHHKGRVTAPCGPILAAGWRAPCRSARLGLEVGGGCAHFSASAGMGRR